MRQNVVTGIEADAAKLIDEKSAHGEVQRIAGQVDSTLERGLNVAVYTSRGVIRSGSATVGKRISEGIAKVMDATTVRPRYLLVKGSMTASNISTQAFGVKRATVMGQVHPGAPV